MSRAANPDGSKTSAYGSGHYQNTISLFSSKILNNLKNTTNNIYKLQKNIVPEMNAGWLADQEGVRTSP
jgi:hypothetical protein